MKSIHVLLSLASPMYIAYPENKSRDNLLQTAKMPVVQKNGVSNVPYYPGNGLRGGLRRCAMRRIIQNFIDKGTKVSESLYLGLSCGAADASPDMNSYVEEIVRARANVYMGTFGGGARLHQSLFRSSDMVPITPETISAGLIAPFYANEGFTANGGEGKGNVWRLLGERTLVRVDDIMRVSQVELIKNGITDSISAVSAHQAAVTKNADDRKKNKDALPSEDRVKKTDVSNMMSYESIAAGTPCYLRLDVNDAATEAQVGMLLLCLSDLFRENAFGGLVRTGFGRVQVQEIRLLQDGADPIVMEDFYDAEGGSFTLPDNARALTQAALFEIDKLMVEELQSFFDKPESADQSKRKRPTKNTPAEDTAEA